jgi:hypothetical protein
MKWVAIDDVIAAWSGELEPLVRAIEDGKILTEEASEFLCLYLRGEIKWPRGNKRTYSQILRDQNLAFEIELMAASRNLSKEQAICEYCDATGANFETVRSAIKRAFKEPKSFKNVSGSIRDHLPFGEHYRFWSP